MKNEKYFTIDELEAFKYFQIPKSLMNKKYDGLRFEAKFLYGILFERTKLSRKEGWYDEKGRAYIFFERIEAADMFKIGEKKVSILFKALSEFELIHEVSEGKGTKNKIYVLKSVIREEHENRKYKKSKDLRKEKKEKYSKQNGDRQNGSQESDRQNGSRATAKMEVSRPPKWRYSNKDFSNKDISNNNNNMKPEKSKKDDVVGDEKLIKSLNEVKNYFQQDIKKYPNTQDIDSMQRVLVMPLSVPITYESRTKIVIDTLRDIHQNYKTKNPKGKINSFNYFIDPITQAFESELDNQTNSKNQGVPNDEHTAEIDFDNFATNK